MCVVVLSMQQTYIDNRNMPSVNTLTYYIVGLIVYKHVFSVVQVCLGFTQWDQDEI